MNQQSEKMQAQEMGEYVAELQLHMSLQARNLVPRLNSTNDSREQFLQETQAHLEKLISRQRLS
jgi:hypothetical protein